MRDCNDRVARNTSPYFVKKRSMRSYPTNNKQLYMMKQDIADWLSNLYPDWRPITADNLLESLGIKFQIRYFFSIYYISLPI